jgi:nucleoside-diphosphate-sugar epimerase
LPAFIHKTNELLSALSDLTVLVTGCSGFLGSTLVAMLQQLQVKVIGVSRTAASPDVSASMIWRQGDVGKRDIWEAVFDRQIDAVFHCAAQTSAYTANNAPEIDLNNNVVPMIHLLDTCRRLAIKPFIVLASTITISGLAQVAFIDEDTQDAPLTVYDLHKLFLEKYLRSYIARGLARGTALRLANVYGPGPLSSNADRGILNQMIHRAIRGEPLRVYQPGTFVRDYLHVHDAATAFLLAAARAEVTNGRHFVIGTGIGRSLLDAANLVAARVGERTGVNVSVELVPSLNDHSLIEERQYAVDSRQFRDVTGWQPHISLPEGILTVMEETI